MATTMGFNSSYTISVQKAVILITLNRLSNDCVCVCQPIENVELCSINGGEINMAASIESKLIYL